MVEYSAMGTGTTLSLYLEAKNWMAAQWDALPEETREKWRAEWSSDEDDGTGRIVPR